MMRKLTNLVLTISLVAGVVGAASADRSDRKPTCQNFAGAWYYPYSGPAWNAGSWQHAGTPFHGAKWTKDYEGEVTYVDHCRLQIKADGSGDTMTFFIYPGDTQFEPSWNGVREGSKVKVRCDDIHRARRVHVVPYYKWLKGQTK